MKFGENEILEREKRLFSSEHRFVNRMRLDALCFQLFLTLGIVAVLAVCLAGAFRGIVNSAPKVGEKQIMTSSRTTVLYDKDGNELQRLDGSGIRQDYVKLDQISVAARNAFIAADDTDYYKHHGVDIRSFFYAFYPDLQGKVSACLPEVMDTSCSSSLSGIRLCGIPILRICIGSAPLSILTASCATLLFPVSVSEALSFAVPTVSISTVSRSETS